MKNIFIPILFLFFIQQGIAQQKKSNIEGGTPCSAMENKSAVKLYEKGIDKKKYNFDERLKFIKEAIALEPEYVEALYQAAMYNITLAKGEGKSFKPAEKYLLEVVRICPTYNPYAYFYLGQIAYGANNLKDASKFMAEFIKDPENAKTDEDYKTAENIYKDAKETDKLFSNPVPFEPFPLEGVNTHEDEYLAMMSPDNENIYYTKRYMKQGRNELVPVQTEEFTVSYLREGKWVGHEALDPPFNVGDNYGGCTFSLDNKKMFVTVCKPTKGGYKNCDIYMSVSKKDMWTNLVNLGPGVNTEDGWEAQPSLSGDGKTLYFATARADSKGMDIYYSELQENGEWGQAKSMGPTINTDGNEKSPFIHSDSQTLYYSSDTHQGAGGYDVFYTKANEEGKWNKPKNIGVPINTEKDEVGFFASIDGHFGYFASNQLKGKGKGGYDIFSFDLYQEARPEKIMFLRGTLLNDGEAAVNDTEIEIKTVDSKKVTKVKVDSMTGSYAAIVTLKKNEDAIMTVKKQGYGFTSQYLKNNDSLIGKPANVDFTIKETKPGTAFTINNINYRTGSADLLPESYVVIEELADYLKTNDIKIEIGGHTDNAGNPASNLALSTDRAFTVYDVLLQKGVSKSRIAFKGYGDKKPIAPNTNEENKAKNRRTEFVIL